MISPSNPTDAIQKLSSSLLSNKNSQVAAKLSIVSQTAIANSSNTLLQLSSKATIPKAIASQLPQNGTQVIQIVLSNGQSHSAQISVQQNSGNQLSIQLNSQIAALLTAGNNAPKLQLQMIQQGLVLSNNQTAANTMANTSNNTQGQVSNSNTQGQASSTTNQSSTTAISQTTSSANTQQAVASNKQAQGAAINSSTAKTTTETTANSSVKTTATSNNNLDKSSADQSLSSKAAVKQISQQLRASLPYQQSLSNLPNLLQNTDKAIQLATPNSTATNTGQTTQSQYLQNVQQAVQQLIKTLPNIEQMQTTDGLQKALIDSGLFLENKLALLATAKASPQAQKLLESSIAKDVKTQLLRLANAIINTPHASPKQTQQPLNQLVTQLLAYSKQLNTEQKKNDSQQKAETAIKILSKQLAGNIANTEVNQMESLRNMLNQAADNPKMISWNTEIALNNEYIDHLAIKIEKDEHSKNDEDIGEQWRVNLSFNLHENGKLNVLLSIIDNTVGAQLWSEKENTHQTVTEYKNELSEMLSRAGVHVKEISCHHGTPKLAANQLERYYFSKHPLIDVKT